MKTLNQVEARTPITNLPYTISSSGSYYLTGNLSFGSGTGIVVAANNVVIDLNGFTIDGNPVTSQYGIRASAGTRNITIRNGSIENVRSTATYQHGAINLTSSEHATIENMNIRNCSQGIQLGQGIIKDCVVTEMTPGGDANKGIYIYGGVIKNCVVDTIDNASGSAAGIYGSGAVIKDCVVRNITGTAVGYRGTGIVLNDGCSVINCYVEDCYYGIFCYIGGVALNNTVRDCTRGISGNQGLVIRENTAISCGESFRVSSSTSNNVVIGNTALGSTNTAYNLSASTCAGPISTSASPTNNPWANIER
jgi:hypothetical protein